MDHFALIFEERIGASTDSWRWFPSWILPDLFPMLVRAFVTTNSEDTLCGHSLYELSCLCRF